MLYLKQLNILFKCLCLNVKVTVFFKNDNVIEDKNRFWKYTSFKNTKEK